MSSIRKTILIIVSIIVSAAVLALLSQSQQIANPKLYWFIPDGVRAEPNLFAIYSWAEEGKLPNIKKMMDNGSYGYSKPVFPSHTPANFATLLTGTNPDVHGVNDGPMRAIGKPLDSVAIGGFRSVAKKVEPIWTTLEKSGNTVGIISVPGSTPPEINKGVVLRGRWGGWGADFHPINFETKGDNSKRYEQGRGARLFFFGPELSQYLDPQPATEWSNPPQSYSDPLEVSLKGWGSTLYGYIFDSTNDQLKNYDRVAFSTDKQSIAGSIVQHGWTDWMPITLKWQSGEKVADVNTFVKATVIKLDDNGFFRIRLLYDNLNEYITQPATASQVFHEQAGSMVDFVDNFPPQLIFYPEDKQTFLDETWMSFDWHTKAIATMVNSFAPDVVIHNIYSPNQMLTSRWWMGYVDPKSNRYAEVSANERKQLWSEVENMYKRLDDMVGEIMKNADENTYIVFSSDHGAIPLDRYVKLNNLFAQKGWLKFTIDKNGEPIIDWKNSQVIYLKMAHVYIKPEGLAGAYQRSSGPEYEKLRDEVRSALLTLADENGIKPVIRVTNWENAQEFEKLDPERLGDLVIANEAGYGWNEEMSKDLVVFQTPLISGYKQAVDPTANNGMWTPFIIMGPGIKKNNFLGDSPVNHVDQYATIMTALKEKLPQATQGEVLPIFGE